MYVLGGKNKHRKPKMSNLKTGPLGASAQLITFIWTHLFNKKSFLLCSRFEEKHAKPTTVPLKWGRSPIRSDILLRSRFDNFELRSQEHCSSDSLRCFADWQTATSDKLWLLFYRKLVFSCRCVVWTFNWATEGSGWMKRKTDALDRYREQSF